MVPPASASIAAALVSLGFFSLVACSDAPSDSAARPTTTSHPDGGQNDAGGNPSASPAASAGTGGGDNGAAPDAAPPDDSARAGWTLVWRDEFDLPDGSPI